MHLSPTSEIYSFESFEYFPDEGTYRALFDDDEISPSEAVVGVISAIADVDPLDVEPLDSEIDGDALDTIVAPRSTSEGDVHVSLALNEFDVTVSSYGSVVVRAPPSLERDR